MLHRSKITVLLMQLNKNVFQVKRRNYVSTDTVDENR